MNRIQSSAVVSFSLVVFVITLAVGAQDVIITTELRPKQLGFKFVEQRVDTTSGFIIGGKNRTRDIKRLTSLDGQSIERLETSMRPGGAAKAGFLGKSERLLDVLATDNAYVVDELGLTHQDLARPLLVIGYYAKKNARADGVRMQHGDLALHVNIQSSRGFQASPFLDGTKTNTDVTIKRLSDGKELKYSLLVPLMIERYGFYEGRGTPYRVDPKAIVELFELKKAK